MSRRLSWAVRLVALVGLAGTLSGCAVYATPGHAYRGYGYRAPGYGYGYGGPPLRPYYRPYYGYGGGWYGRGYGGYGRPYW